MHIMATDTIQKNIDTIAHNARLASAGLLDAPHSRINACIRTMAGLLKANAAMLKKANAKDCTLAREKHLAPAMIERLTLTDSTLASMSKGLIELTRLANPVGMVFDERTRPNGLRIHKVKVPIGVIGIIYESRPNVTIDAAALCIKAHNAVILRGGSEAFNTNTALAKLFSKAMTDAKLPKNAVQIIPTTDRAAVSFLLKKSDDIDLIIPRGGESLIRTVVEQSHIPVIKHYKGVCHLYVTKNADITKAIAIALNGKIQRPSVCNALEKLLFDIKVTDKNKRAVIDALLANKVTLFADAAIRKLYPELAEATTDDWYAEYLDLRLTVGVVADINEAIRHINTYGSHHTDAIVTESKKEAAVFCKLVDSASVMVNASTRFSDGGEYGLGCEIGISTDKLHARGPMGIDELTTYKWIVEGSGQTRT
jgi:glutamate-5-semialdehyde dehydrogenase